MKPRRSGTRAGTLLTPLLTAYTAGLTGQTSGRHPCQQPLLGAGDCELVSHYLQLLALLGEHLACGQKTEETVCVKREIGEEFSRPLKYRDWTML
jgi:hypothetical protein